MQRTKWEPVLQEEPTSTDCVEDLRLLLDCLRYHSGRHGSPQRQALTTIATMCSNDSSARDGVRKCGGLSFLLEMVYSRPDTTVLQTSLLTLGCASEKNVVNQSMLCQLQLFSLLSSVLGSHDSHMTLLHSAAYLLGCLMTGNGRGQNMARESGALKSLTSLFRSLLPSRENGEGGEGVMCADGEGVGVWRSVTSALCTATNNPQNEENQRVASCVFPAAMAVISPPLSLHQLHAQSALSLVTSCLASNGSVQSRFAMVGGLQCLTSALRELTKVEREGEMDKLCVYLLQCIYATASGHCSNRETLCSLGCVSRLLSLLRWPDIPLSSLTSLSICLGCLVDGNCAAQREVRDGGGLSLLVSCMTQQQDEELAKAVVFVLQSCLQDHQTSAAETGEAVTSQELEYQTTHSPSRLQASPQTQCAASSSLSASALRSLEDKRPPSLKVKSWLISSPPVPTSSIAMTTSTTRELLPRLQKLLDEIQISPLSRQNGNKSSENGNQRTTQPAVENTGSAAGREKSDVQTKDSVVIRSVEQNQDRETCNGAENMAISMEDIAKPSTAKDVVKSATQEKNAKQEQKSEKSVEGNKDLPHLTGKPSEQSAEQLDNQRTVSVAGNEASQDGEEGDRVMERRTVNDGLEYGNGGLECGAVTEEVEAGSSPRPATASFCETQMEVRWDEEVGEGRKVGVRDEEVGEGRKVGVRDEEVGEGRKVGVRDEEVGEGRKVGVRDEEVGEGRKVGVRDEEGLAGKETDLRKEEKVAREEGRKIETEIMEERNRGPEVTVVEEYEEEVTPQPGSVGSPTFSLSLHCLACHPRLKCPLITSRTFLPVLTSDPSTCPYHHRLATRLSHTHRHSDHQMRNGVDGMRGCVTAECSAGEDIPLENEDMPVEVRHIWRGNVLEDVGRGTESKHGVHRQRYDSTIGGRNDTLVGRRQDEGERDGEEYSEQSSLESSSTSQPSIDNTYCPPSSSESTDSYEISTPSASPSTPGRQLGSVRPDSMLGAVLNHHQNPRPIPLHYATACNQPRKNPRPTSHTRRYELSHCPGAGAGRRKRFPVEYNRVPLGERGNLPRAVWSEYDYSTPANMKKTVAGKGREKKEDKRPPVGVATSRVGVAPSNKVGVVYFSKEEERQLMEGVRRFGRRWRHILSAYQFHHSRTSVNLKDKYRNLTNRRK